MKTFVKGMNQERQTFKYKFLRLSEANVKEVNFDRTTNLATCKSFDLLLEGKEKEAWEALREVIHACLDYKRKDNYTQLETVLL